jgi:WD40 repeat protein
MSINHISYNSIVKNLTCCTNQGYIVYGLEPTLEKKLYIELDGGVGLMKMHEKTNIIILVGGGDTPFKSKDTVMLWDQNKKQGIMEVDMRESIKNALIVMEKIITVVEKKICIFDWAGTLLSTKGTYANEKGLCVISKDLEVVVTLGAKKGELAVWKHMKDIYKTIDAHTTNLEAIAVSTNGRYVATASETGTLIKVFNTETCNLEYEFRRGSTSTVIYDLAFNSDATLLSLISGNGTVHLFELSNDPKESKNIKSVFSGFKDFLPKYFDSEWGFKQINLGNTCRSICAFDEKDVLHITTYDGSYYRINGPSYDNLQQGNLHINNK